MMKRTTQPKLLMHNSEHWRRNADFFSPSSRVRSSVTRVMMMTSPEIQSRYLGFNFSSPVPAVFALFGAWVRMVAQSPGHPLLSQLFGSSSISEPPKHRAWRAGRDHQLIRALNFPSACESASEETLLIRSDRALRSGRSLTADSTSNPHNHQPKGKLIAR
jgi:hypothetical protein